MKTTGISSSILSHKEIHYKLKRIAYQVYENNLEEDELVVVGINQNGYILAKRIAKILQTISDIDVILCKVKIDIMDYPIHIEASLSSDKYKNKSLILIDDVLNSGKTLIYGIKHFLSFPLKRFKTAVLVNRNHKAYPVKADFKGISLSTSMNEHIRVVLSEKGNDAVFLE